ncbi:S49 family peptidase [Candidatus Pacearchaeota archaeon]|nr:S49 family peptidase [Candidatus Pacearchaeota archaeon]
MMNLWLIEPNTREMLLHGERNGIEMNAEQRAEYMTALAGATPDILAVAGDKAEIAIRGVLTNTPNFVAMFLGGGNTTYPDIIAALGAAENDDSISDITLSIDSPGGSVNGLFDTLAAIRSARKPIRAVISNVGASAAYAIAAQADEVMASNRAARIGSVGIATTAKISEDKVDIASTDAPKKVPDASTPKGVAIIREELDAMHQLFVEAIATGRNAATGDNITPDDVSSTFGRGAVLLADAALKRGMIDGIAAPSLAVVGSEGVTRAETTMKIIAKEDEGTNTKTKEGRAMNLREFKAAHPDVFAEAVQTGESKERDRVVAHLLMGEASSDMKTAVEAIKGGEDMTATMHATYMAAGMNKADTTARGGDEEITAAALAAAGGQGAEAKDAADTVADHVCEVLGDDVDAEGGTV